ncbi:MAG: hypothetical protein ACLP8S_27485 [Solirubrobacteraceae bacterium]
MSTYDRTWLRAAPVEDVCGTSALFASGVATSAKRNWSTRLHGPPASRADYRRYLALLSALARRYPRQQGRSFGWAAVIRVVRYDS